MRTLLRGIILVLVVLWVGGILFFPVVAYVSFSNLPDTHTAGTVARICLHILHQEGLIAGLLLLVLLLVEAWLRTDGRRSWLPGAVTLAMLGLTAFSQFSIMTRMDVDRIAVGGSIDAAPAADPHRVEFNRLHRLSENVESGVLLGGVVLIFLLARPPLASRR